MSSLCHCCLEVRYSCLRSTLGKGQARHLVNLDYMSHEVISPTYEFDRVRQGFCSVFFSKSRSSTEKLKQRRYLRPFLTRHVSPVSTGNRRRSPSSQVIRSCKDRFKLTMVFHIPGKSKAFEQVICSCKPAAFRGTRTIHDHRPP